MITAQAIYIALIAVVGCVFRRPPNTPIATGAERFRVSEGFRWGCLAFGMCFAAASLATMLLTPRHDELGVMFLLAMADVLAMALVYLFVAYWSLAIEVDDGAVTLTRLYGPRLYPNASIRRVTVTVGSGAKGAGGRRVTLYDERGQRIVQMTPNFPDVERFIVLMKLNLSHTAKIIDRG